MGALRPAHDARRAIILLSGGLDSTTVLAMAVREGYEVTAVTFRYGQRHAHEVDAARRIASRYAVVHQVIDIDLHTVGGSALTTGIPVPKGRTREEVGRGVPVTYVPARNTIFLAVALAWAEVVGAHDIFIGVNVLDSSGYPDCRPEFIAAFERLANLATRTGVEGGAPFRIRAPLIEMSKRDIVLAGRALGVDYADTTSCYDPDQTGAACGNCDACQLRRRGFQDAGIPDPTPYQHASLTPA